MKLKKVCSGKLKMLLNGRHVAYCSNTVELYKLFVQLYICKLYLKIVSK